MDFERYMEVLRDFRKRIKFKVYILNIYLYENKMSVYKIVYSILKLKIYNLLIVVNFFNMKFFIILFFFYELLGLLKCLVIL